MEHNDPHLEVLDCISITFEMQKKDKMNNTVTQKASCAINMCPVQMAASIVRRIRSYKGSNDNTPISAFWRFNRIDHVTFDAVHVWNVPTEAHKLDRCREEEVPRTSDFCQ